MERDRERAENNCKDNRRGGAEEGRAREKWAEKKMSRKTARGKQSRHREQEGREKCALAQAQCSSDDRWDEEDAASVTGVLWHAPRPLESAAHLQDPLTHTHTCLCTYESSSHQEEKGERERE